MLDCWQVAPQRRPTFTELSQHLSKLFSDERVTIRVFVRNGGMMFELVFRWKTHKTCMIIHSRGRSKAVHLKITVDLAVMLFSKFWKQNGKKCKWEIERTTGFLRNCINCVNCDDHFFISAVHICFISYIINTHFSRGNIWTHNWPAPNVSGLIAQLVEHRTSNREVTGSNPVEVLDSFQASLRNCINCVNCDDHFFISKANNKDAN